MKKRYFIVLVILVIVSAAWMLWIPLRQTSSATVMAKTVSAVSTTKTVAHESGSSARPVSPSIRTVQNPNRFAKLLAAANGGDANAAYQLAQARQACMKLNTSKWLYSNAQDNLNSDPGGPDAKGQRAQAIKELFAMRAELQRLGETCLGDSSVTFEELNETLRRAAQLGSRDAQYEYALDPRLNFMSIGTDTARWKEWRDNAPRYLNDLLDAGDSRAALAFAAASAQDDCVTPTTMSSDADICRDSGALATILPQQEKFSYMYYVLDQLLSDKANATWVANELMLLERSLTPDEIASARAEAQRRFLQIHPGS